MHSYSELYSVFQKEGIDIELEQRAAVIEAVLARKIAYDLPLPSAPVDALVDFYGTHNQAAVNKAVCEFNEGFPVNVHTTVELVFQLWRARYYLVHNPNYLLANDLLKLIGEGDTDFARALNPRYAEVIAFPVPARVRGVVEGFVSGN